VVALFLLPEVEVEVVVEVAVAGEGAEAEAASAPSRLHLAPVTSMLFSSAGVTDAKTPAGRGS
jgi:hypothetical protein